MGTSWSPAQSYAHVWISVREWARVDSTPGSELMGLAIHGWTDGVAGADWESSGAEI